MSNKYDLEQLKLELACSIGSFCLHFFPNGKCRYGEYCVGSLKGEPGESLRICMKGAKVGIWRDFASGEGGNNLLDLLCKARGGDFKVAWKEAAEWLGNPGLIQIGYHAFMKKLNQDRLARMSKFREDAPPDESYDFTDLRKGTERDHTILARLLGVTVESLLVASWNGVLKYFTHRGGNGRCWSVVNKGGKVRQDRRMDGQPFILADKKTAKARTIGNPSWPIGVPTDKDTILLSEGSSDILAAYALIYSEELENKVAPVTMLGAANRIHNNALQYFKNKYVFGFPDYDAAGIEGMARWHDQLKGISAGFEVFDYTHLRRYDGQEVKDLRDFLRVDVDQWESFQSVRYPIAQFIFKVLKQ